MKYTITLDENDLDLLKRSLDYLKEKTANQNSRVAYARVLSTIEACTRKQTDDISYLKGLSESCKELYFDFKSSYGVDMYHSIAAVFDNAAKTEPDICLEKLQKIYFDKYKDSRSLIIKHPSDTKEVIEHVYKRVRNKRQI